MHSSLSALVLSLAFAAGCSAAQSGTPTLTAAATHDTIALTNVRVITMESDAVLDDQTVIVAGGRVFSILPKASAHVPASATVIDGAGRYLIPGLIDMHVHTLQADLPVYVSNGITSMRNMWGTPWLETAPRGDDGSIIPAAMSPAIYSASPGIDAAPASWPYTQFLEDPTRADSLVGALAAKGWRWLKVYNRLTLASYDSLVVAARRHGIAFIGHVPFDVTIEHALESGQLSVEHLTGYDRALSGGALGALAWVSADLSAAPRLVALTRQAGTWNCPTLVVLDAISAGAAPQTRDLARANRYAFIRALHDGGARLLAGTDSGIEQTAPGTSLHDELAAFVAAGLTPYDALVAATRDAAVFLGRSGDIGTIRVGGRADLLLLRGNPLADIRNTRAIDGVMMRGVWYARATR